MTRVRFIPAVLSSILLCVGAAQAADKYSPTVTVTVTPPSGKAQTLDVRESEAQTVTLDNGTFIFKPRIEDAKPWKQVTITIFKAATASSPDEMLGDVQVTTGGPAVTSKTNPVFKIAVTKVTAPDPVPGLGGK